MSSATSHSIRFGSTIIHYAIVRSPSRQKSITIQVQPDGAVFVRAPKGTRTRKIEVLVTQKAPWILSKSAGVQSKRNAVLHEFVSGESLHYLGRHYRLKIHSAINADARPVALRGGFFFVCVERNMAATKQAEVVHHRLQDWYREHARAKLAERLALFCPKLGYTDTPRFLIRDQRNRWASCDAGGLMRFNWRIIMAPISLVDYVVAHELCHLRYPDHSRSFWRLLRSILPDYEDRKLRLAEEGSSFDL